MSNHRITGAPRSRKRGAPLPCGVIGGSAPPAPCSSASPSLVAAESCRSHEVTVTSTPQRHKDCEPPPSIRVLISSQIRSRLQDAAAIWSINERTVNGERDVPPMDCSRIRFEGSRGSERDRGKKGPKRNFDLFHVFRSLPGIKHDKVSSRIWTAGCPDQYSSYEQGSHYPRGHETGRHVPSNWQIATAALPKSTPRVEDLLLNRWRSTMATWIIGGFACVQGSDAIERSGVHANGESTRQEDPLL